MSKKTSKKEDFTAQSADELQKFVTDSRKKLETLSLSLSSKNPAEKRMLRRSVARALTALGAK